MPGAITAQVCPRREENRPRDIEALIGFYASGRTYKDRQTAAGIVGHAALCAYLTGLFAATSLMTYDPDAWFRPGGFRRRPDWLERGLRSPPALNRGSYPVDRGWGPKMG